MPCHPARCLRTQAPADLCGHPPDPSSLSKQGPGFQEGREGKDPSCWDAREVLGPEHSSWFSELSTARPPPALPARLVNGQSS